MQVVRRATHGALLHCDCLVAPSWQSDPWAQWLAWQTGRWLKSLGIIRPLYCERLLFHEDSVIEQVRHAAPCPLTADLGSAAPPDTPAVPRRFCYPRRCTHPCGSRMQADRRECRCMCACRLRRASVPPWLCRCKPRLALK